MDLLRDPANKGMRAKIARELGIHPGAITQWRQIPPERVPAISRITGFSRHQLRPDLWEPPDACACALAEPLEAA